MLGCAVLVGCADDGARAPAGFDREVRGGALHAAPVEGVTAGAVELARVLRTAAPLQGVVVGVGADQLDPRVASTDAGAAPLTTVFAGQELDGVPIHGAYLYLAMRPGVGGAGVLVGSSYHLYQGAHVDTEPAMARELAESLARAALRATVDAPVRSAELAIWPMAGELTLVWDVVLEGGETRALVLAGGLRVGQVDVRDDRIYDTSGTVTGWIAVGGAPGGTGTSKQVPLADVEVEAGAATALTGGDGRYTVAPRGGGMVSAAAAGRAVRVVSADGATASASAPVAARVDLTLGSPAGERPLAVVTAYHAATRTRAFLLANGFTADQLGGPVDVRVNLPDSCNAYFLPGQRSLNFLRAGRACRNTAESTIVAHEYGHFVDDSFGGIVDAGLSEGWGDLLACLSTRQPVIGGDMFDNGGFVRTCDNDYRFPASGKDDDVHDLGQAWAGFGWHVREGLIARLGAGAGDDLARALLLPSLISNAPDTVAAVREVFLRDDDDGDLRNHTPHWDVLVAAAERHGLGFVVEQDLAPPARIADLTATAATATRVELRWTAPGDDDRRGTAATYELRWATRPITDASFAAATPLPTPAPTAAGSVQETSVVVPPVGTLYLAVRAVDELGNAGPLSNRLTVTLAPAAVLFTDSAEHGLGGWTATGLWHVTGHHAAQGHASFWYGKEDTGTYDTGGRNRGALTSPVIDLGGAVRPVLVLAERVDVESDPAHDRLTITVQDVDDPDVAISATKLTGWTGSFAPRLLDLAGLAGRRIQLRFEVDTVDRTGNAGQGWSLDDVEVIADRGPGAPPPAGTLMINEVLVDPPDGYDGNRDGAGSARGDEFVELINVGDTVVDLAGATLADSAQVRVTFGPGTRLAPGAVAVVFGGSAPTIAGVVTVPSDGLFLNIDGDGLYLRRPGGALVAELTWGAEGGHDQSLTREVDGDPESPMVGHRTRSAQPASPGSRADGRPFGGAPPPPAAPRLIVNEVLADPPAGYDADGDGVASVITDEFVELVNVGAAPLDLSGGSISDTERVRGVFAAGTVVPAGKALVVFGGGTVHLPGIAAVSFGPLQLNNTGDTVTVRTGSGELLAAASFGAEGGRDQSLVRATDGDPTAAFVLHQTRAAAVASPGRRANGQLF